MAKRRKSTKKSAWARVQSAKKGVKAGRKGASASLDRAIKAYAAQSCSVKAAPKKRRAKKTTRKRTRRAKR